MRVDRAAAMACCIGLSLLFLIAAWHPQTTLATAAPMDPQVKASLDAVCASCHRSIYDHYEATPMAHASGPAIDGLIQGAFHHEMSGVQYRIFERDGAAWLSYARPDTSKGGYLSGEVKLVYFLGSNTRGRTYLFQRDGYWFEIPVNWYAKKNIWDMTPNYLNATEMPMTLPVDPNCLYCHAGNVQRTLPGARNHFASAPFTHAGIGCSSCHGDASAHVRTGGKSAVLNPAKLDAPRRDSICLQCHLEGDTAIYRQGRALVDYRPGDALFDDVTYFAHQHDGGPQERATSQYEALLESKCKRSSGDTLTCTTCHDAHGSEAGVGAAERVAFYRAKCLTCHTGATFATAHHPEQRDCAKCHMPRSASEDIAHEQLTDHRIQIPSLPVLEKRGRSTAPLTTIGDEHTTDRDLGLADAQMAQRGDPASLDMALKLLRKAETAQTNGPPDTELHTQLGFLEQKSGDIGAADREYRAALAADANDSTARGNLAVLFASTGDYETAVTLWQRVFEGDPAQAAAGYNLALGECRLGRKDNAQATLKRLLEFAPDDQRARALASALASGRQPCPDSVTSQNSR